MKYEYFRVWKVEPDKILGKVRTLVPLRNRTTSPFNKLSHCVSLNDVAAMRIDFFAAAIDPIICTSLAIIRVR